MTDRSTTTLKYVIYPSRDGNVGIELGDGLPDLDGVETDGLGLTFNARLRKYGPYWKAIGDNARALLSALFAEPVRRVRLFPRGAIVHWDRADYQAYATLTSDALYRAGLAGHDEIHVIPGPGTYLGAPGADPSSSRVTFTPGGISWFQIRWTGGNPGTPMFEIYRMDPPVKSIQPASATSVADFLAKLGINWDWAELPVLELPGLTEDDAAELERITGELFERLDRLRSLRFTNTPLKGGAEAMQRLTRRVLNDALRRHGIGPHADAPDEDKQ